LDRRTRRNISHPVETEEMKAGDLHRSLTPR
jgi:hypothetical protein